jgi:hypothetical protein
VVEGSTDLAGDVVGATLESLREQTYPADRIEVVFMDASDGRIGAAVRRQFPDAVVVPASHLHYYEMKNEGAAHSSGDIVAFIDSDVTWNREWLSRAATALEPLPAYSAVVGLTRYKPGWFSDVGTVSQFGYHWYKYATRDYNGLIGVIANNFAMRRKEFLDVRYRHTGFRQGMDMVLASDLQQRGGVVRLEPGLRAMHKWGRSKLYEHPQTAYNVGKGLTTAVSNCDWLLNSGTAHTILPQIGTRVNPAWLLEGSVPAVLGLVGVRFWLFHTFLRRTRRELDQQWYELIPGTVFLAGFFAIIGYGAITHRRPAPGDGRPLQRSANGVGTTDGAHAVDAPRPEVPLGTSANAAPGSVAGGACSRGGRGDGAA